MRVLDETEWRAFVLDGTRTGKLATVRSDGAAHVTPIWFVFDDEGRIVFTTATTTVKGRNLRRDPRASLCVDDERPPFAFVRIDGEVTLDEDMEATRRWATAIGGRYMGPDRAAEFGRRNAVEGEMLVRLTPTRVVARGGVSD